MACISFPTDVIYIHRFKYFVMMLSMSLRWHSCGLESLPNPIMDPTEVEAVYRVLEGINYEIDWRSMFPGNPCTGGPHGLNCEVDNDTLHVAEFNLGWVSDDVNNPPCSGNATIDLAILQLSHLKKLFFYQCFIGEQRKIPSEIGEIFSLQHLTFQSNSGLVGEIPGELGSLNKLERLVLSQNSLEGSIPIEIGNLKELQQLSLDKNALAGVIPDSLKYLGNLKVLDLSGNKLSEEIPSTLGRLSSLLKLDLSRNLLTGSIPPDFGNLRNLQLLDLGSNRLNGNIPDSLSKLSSLQYLLLGCNSLGGNLPEFWGNLTGMISLQLSHSKFEGYIPESLGLLRGLNSLTLDNNRLVGVIPSSLGELPSLYKLNLSFNMLTGEIPFPVSFVRRLGHNVDVRNNTGLCYGLSLMTSSSIEVDYCWTSLSSPRGSPLSVSVTKSRYAGSMGKVHILALLTIIALCFSTYS